MNSAASMSKPATTGLLSQEFNQINPIQVYEAKNKKR